MKLDPQAQAVLDELRSKTGSIAKHRSGDDWIDIYREQLLVFRDFGGAAEPCDEEDIRSDLAHGALTIRLYRPPAQAASELPSPALLFIHGGGFIGGSFETHALPLRALARRSGCVIAAVDYRLAPKHPWPAAPEDCYSALAFLSANAASLGIDPRRLAVGGDSAGGLLAAAVAILARDRGGPAIQLQVVLYPNMDLREERHYPSMSEYDGNVVVLEELHRGLRMYLPAGIDRAIATISPVLSNNLAHLPPALVVTCECDPLRDEGERYVQQLREADVEVAHMRYSGMIHGVLQMAGRIAAGRALIDQLASALRFIEAG